MVEMIASSREKPRGKSVLLYSGGMDSFIIGTLMRPDIWLYLPQQTPYVAQEQKAVRALESCGATPAVTELYGALDLSAFERTDAIVPNRNSHLVLLASNYGERIWLAAVNGDRSTDKDEEFCSRQQALLNHMWSPSHWCEGREFEVQLPGKERTKTQLVADYLHAGHDPAHLLTSYSCYEGRDQHCGVCKPCFRKWVSLVNNRVSIPSSYWASNPVLAEWLPQVRDAIYAGKWRGDEDMDIQRALDAWL